MKNLSLIAFSHALKMALSLVLVGFLLTSCGGSGVAVGEVNKNTVNGDEATQDNFPPSAEAGNSISVTVNTPVDITGSGVDFDGKIVAYQWSEDGTVLADSASFSYTPATVGEHTLTLTVTDDKSASGMAPLTVIAQAAPVAEIPCISLEDLAAKINNKEDVTKVNTACIADMSALFYNATDFNQDISGWDVSNVTDMRWMFESATAFNQDISTWDVSNVTSMGYMFAQAENFNQPIGAWGMANVTSISGMFTGAKAFNQPIANWNTSNIVSMHNTFLGATAFTNHDLSHWDVAKVKSHDDFMTDTGGNNVEPLWNSTDKTPPVITLNGGDVTIEQGATYVDAGATAVDNIDGDITPAVSNNVDTQTIATYTVIYTATDAAGNSSTATRIVTVIAKTPQNNAPSADAGSDASTQVNTSVTLAGFGNDTDGTITNYQWSEGTTVLATTVSFKYTPTTIGEHTLTLTVTDNDGATATDTVKITATKAPNIAPTVNAGADTTVQVNKAITLIGTGTDTDGTITNYQWSEGTTVLATTASFDYTPSTLGKHTLTFTVYDNDGAKATDTVKITATKAPNVAPTANAGADATIQANKSITLTGTGTDTDGTITSYQWSEGTTVLATTVSFKYTPTTIGDHTLTLTVTDNDGATATDTVKITATKAPNIAPTVNAGADTTVQVNKAITLIGTGTDTDGTITNYQWSEGTTVLATTASFKYTPTAIGDHTLTLTVTDNDGAKATDTLKVTTTAAPDRTAPVITLLGDASVTVEAGTSYSDLGATALDNKDGDLTNEIVTGGSVNVNLPATYTLTYNVQDSATNAAVEVTRTVIVVKDHSSLPLEGTGIAGIGNYLLNKNESLETADGRDAISLNDSTYDKSKRLIFTPKQKYMTIGMTNIFEYSSIEEQSGRGYEYCAIPDKEHGITHGKVGLATGTGSSYEFIRDYYNKPDNEMLQYMTELERLNKIYEKVGNSGVSNEIHNPESNSYIDGLGGLKAFCETWTRLVKEDPFMNRAQDIYVNTEKYKKIVTYAEKFNLHLPISLMALYDAQVLQGELYSVTTGMGLGRYEGTTVNGEVKWLRQFNENRKKFILSKPYWGEGAAHRPISHNTLLDRAMNGERGILWLDFTTFKVTYSNGGVSIFTFHPEDVNAGL